MIPAVGGGATVDQHVEVERERCDWRAGFGDHLDIGILPLTGTSDGNHMRAYLEILDFCLTPEEGVRIEGLTVR